MISFSWDDGHPNDLRVAEILQKYSIGATFYIPHSNSEGLPVMNANDIRHLDESGFQIGSHTNTHRDLTAISCREAKEEIYAGKAWLQDCLGKEVDCFCYPRGNYNKKVIEIVREVGFKTARTVRNYHRGTHFDPFVVPTTLQIFPHPRAVLLRNFISGGDYIERFDVFKCVLKGDDLLSRLLGICNISNHDSHRIHFWGHSSELDGFAGWDVLKDLVSSDLVAQT